jgi:hypothetical protein
MNVFDNIINDWYKLNGEKINTDYRIHYLLILFEELKSNNFLKEHLEEYGHKICYLLNREFVDEYLTRAYNTIISEEIRQAFYIVNKNIKEIKDLDLSTEAVEVGGGIYNQSSEDEYMSPNEIDYNDDEVDENFMEYLEKAWEVKNG